MNLYPPRVLCSIVFTLLLTLTQVGIAHNGGILVQLRNGQLDIGADPEQEGAAPDFDTNVFTSLFASNYLQDLPSYLSLATAPAGTDPLPLGANLYWDFLPMNNNGTISNLLYWNGEGTSLGDVAFGHVPQAGVSLGMFNIEDIESAIVEGDDHMVTGALLGTTTTQAEDDLRLHYHNLYYLDDGDGVAPTVVPDGVYLTAMRLRMPGAAPSDPFFVMVATFPLITNSFESVDLAFDWVEQQQEQLIADGDYNFDGQVDATDYSVWKQQLGLDAASFVDGPWADGNRDGQVDLADYTVWRNNLTAANSQSASAVAVPEPHAVGLVVGLVAMSLVVRRRTR